MRRIVQKQLYDSLKRELGVSEMKKRLDQPRFLIGYSCTSVVQQDFSWFIGMGDKCGVTIECPWRIIAGGRIAVTNTDQGRKFGLPQPVDVPSTARQLLDGHSIVNVRIDVETSDLHIWFDHDRRIDILNDSSGYECWQLTSPDGQLWVGRNA